MPDRHFPSRPRLRRLKREAQAASSCGDSGYFWNALYQQRPVASEGGMFKRAWFKPIERSKLRAMVAAGGTWPRPRAGARNTAGLRVGKDGDGSFYITGLEHVQRHPGDRDRLIVQTAQRDGQRVAQLPAGPTRSKLDGED